MLYWNKVQEMKPVLINFPFFDTIEIIIDHLNLSGCY